MSDTLIPIGTVVAAKNKYKGSWLKISHETGIDSALLVKHFEDAAKATQLLRKAKEFLAIPSPDKLGGTVQTEISWHREPMRKLHEEIDALLKGN